MTRYSTNLCAILNRVNTLLADVEAVRDRLPITSLQAMRDGIILCYLLHRVCGKTTGLLEKLYFDFSDSRTAHFYQLANNAMIIEFSQRFLGVKIVNICPADLVAGNERLVLGLLWQILKRSQQIASPSAEEGSEADGLPSAAEEQKIDERASEMSVSIQTGDYEECRVAAAAREEEATISENEDSALSYSSSISDIAPIVARLPLKSGDYSCPTTNLVLCLEDSQRLRKLFMGISNSQLLASCIFGKDLSAQSVILDSKISGPIASLSAFLKKWTKSFAVIKDNFLFIYESRLSLMPKSVERLDDCAWRIHSRASEIDAEIAIDLASNVDCRTVYIRLTSLGDRQRWISAIDAASKWWIMRHMQ